MPERDTLVFKIDAGRQARLLRLAREQREENRRPDSFCRYGFAVYIILGALALLTFGAVFQNRTLLLSVWAVVSAFLGLPVLIVSYARQSAGMASWHHRFSGAELTLGEETLELCMRTPSKHKPERYRWVLSYGAIRRMDYDRASKTLRIYGAFDTEESILPRIKGLPAGMTQQPPEVTQTENTQYIDILLFYDKSGAFVKEIEARTGIFVHTAMRADDYAELRDLPGLKRDRTFTRPMAAAILAYTVGFLVFSLWIQNYYAQNPYKPYPATDPADLTALHAPDVPVTLEIGRASCRERV